MPYEVTSVYYHRTLDAVVIYTSYAMSHTQFVIYKFERDQWTARDFKVPEDALGLAEENDVFLTRLQIKRTYLYIAGEFDEDIVCVCSVKLISEGMKKDQVKQNKTNIIIFDSEGRNIRTHTIPLEEFKPFRKDEFISPDFYRLFACKDRLILRWFDNDMVLFINLYSLSEMGFLVQRTFIRTLYTWRYNARNQTQDDVTNDSLNLFGCEIDGSFYIFTPRPTPAVRYFKRGSLHPVIWQLYPGFDKLRLHDIRSGPFPFTNIQLSTDLLLRALNFRGTRQANNCIEDLGSGGFVVNLFHHKFCIFSNNAGDLIAWWWPRRPLSGKATLLANVFRPTQSYNRYSHINGNMNLTTTNCSTFG
jgi:hypothetical protein